MHLQGRPAAVASGRIARAKKFYFKSSKSFTRPHGSESALPRLWSDRKVIRLAMNKFAPFESRYVILPIDNVDTDQIIPARFLKTISKEGLGDQLFND